MRRTSQLFAVLLMGFLSAAAIADDEPMPVPSEHWTSYMKALPLKPERVDGPLRDFGLSDIEVKQLESIVLGLYPGAILGIGPVTSECPCEEGPTCSAQVWIVAYDLGQSHGLMLSRIDGEWRLGPAQDWWLDYEKLIARMRLALDERGDWNGGTIDLIPWYPHFAVRQANSKYGRLADEQALLMTRAPRCSPDA